MISMKLCYVMLCHVMSVLMMNGRMDGWKVGIDEC